LGTLTKIRPVELKTLGMRLEADVGDLAVTHRIDDRERATAVTDEDAAKERDELASPQ
jgi:hypothetical protein